MTSWYENISALLALCEGNQPMTDESLSHFPRHCPFVVSLIKLLRATLDWPVIRDTMTVIWRNECIQIYLIYSPIYFRYASMAQQSNRKFAPAQWITLQDIVVDDWYQITWWRHQMETFSALLALCAGNSPSPVNSPHKGQWRGALMFSLICAWINGRVHTREAGDLRRNRTHYDVIVILKQSLNCIHNSWSALY